MRYPPPPILRKPAVSRAKDIQPVFFELEPEGLQDPLLPEQIPLQTLSSPLQSESQPISPVEQISVLSAQPEQPPIAPVPSIAKPLPLPAESLPDEVTAAAAGLDPDDIPHLEDQLDRFIKKRRRRKHKKKTRSNPPSRSGGSHLIDLNF